MELHKANDQLNLQQKFNNNTKSLDETIKNQRQPSKKTGRGYEGSKSPRSIFYIGAINFVYVLKGSTSRKS